MDAEKLIRIKEAEERARELMETHRRTAEEIVSRAREER
jgi:vacuolar-type H+-ATPase subunit H